MDLKKVIIPGGSGFIGDYVSRYFVDRGFEVVVLSRTKVGFVNGIRYVFWDAVTIDKWVEFLEGAFAVINLTGRSINCRFTKKNKEEIFQSRVDSVKILLEACNQSKVPPMVFIQTSSIGYYGNTVELCTEDSPVGSDFLAKVCSVWEDSFWAKPFSTTRKVVLRFGIVLDNGGGALQRMLPWVKWYLGGKHGNGKQSISWIHLEDLSRMFEFTIKTSTIEGTFNAVADFPVSNAGFMSTLREVLHKPWAPPVPSIAVRLAAFLFMHTDSNVLLHGVGCTSKKIQQMGFVFKYPKLKQALNDLLR